VSNDLTARILKSWQTLVVAAIVLLAAGASARAVQQNAKERRPMSSNKDPRAVAVARAHIEAWSHHDWEKARRSLAPDVHVTVTTTQTIMSSTDTVGVDKYMEGLTKFATGVAPGSAHILAAVGDSQNALVMVTVKAAMGPGGQQVTLPGARLYLLDDSGKIKAEQVVFFALQE